MRTAQKCTYEEMWRRMCKRAWLKAAGLVRGEVLEDVVRPVGVQRGV